MKSKITKRQIHNIEVELRNLIKIRTDKNKIYKLLQIYYPCWHHGLNKLVSDSKEINRLVTNAGQKLRKLKRAYAKQTGGTY